ncbi:hypothetical protein [Streptomyces sp. NPDC002172]
MEANRATGTIEPGTTADDVLLLIGPLWRVGEDGLGHPRAARLFDVLLRGLCPSGTAHGTAAVGGARSAG